MSKIGGNRIESDRTEFFSVIFSETLSIRTLISFLSSYCGAVFSDQMHYATLAINRLTNSHFSQSEVFEADKSLNEEIARLFTPDLLPLYCSRSSEAVFDEKCVLHTTINDQKNHDLPAALNQRSARDTRGQFSILSAQGRYLFVSPNSFQYFDPQAGCYFKQATTRRIGKAALDLEIKKYQGPVVLIQDYGDGANFAHFLFDWVTRIIHYISFNRFAETASFILGGTRTHYHDLFLMLICSRYGLQLSQFIFPAQPMLIEIQGEFICFSDQIVAPLHPAQMAHPKSVALLRDLALSLPISRQSGSLPKRVFLSRADAKLRRIVNEDEIFAIAEKHGFQRVVMSDLDIVQQCKLFRNAEAIIGPHGMAFSHIVFCFPGTRVCELFHPTLGTDAYAMISRSLNLDYGFALGESLEDDKASYRVDPTVFEKALIGCL